MVVVVVERANVIGSFITTNANDGSGGCVSRLCVTFDLTCGGGGGGGQVLWG